MDQAEFDVLLTLDGACFEIAEGYLVEFSAHRTAVTEERPHGLSYALVFRALGGQPIIRFDNAHAVAHRGGKYVKGAKSYDHWHQTERDKGRPYPFSTVMQLLDDFWIEVRRVMNDRGIPNDL